jgi:integrase
VHLSSQAVALFREAVRECGDGEYVFQADMSKVKIEKSPLTPHINGDSVSRAIARLREAAGVDDVSIHDMRRAISYWLKNQGVSREVRDLILNHIDPSVTESVYTPNARMEKQVRQALQMWSNHVWEITGQSIGASNVVALRA